MKIYIDLKDFSAHMYPQENFLEYECEFFNGKCEQFIEGYRVVPYGYEWKHEGHIFTGEMISPLKSYQIIKAAQDSFEEAERKNGVFEAQTLELIYNLIMEGE